MKAPDEATLRKNSRTGTWVFWVTIVALACVVVAIKGGVLRIEGGVLMIGKVVPQPECEEEVVEIPTSVLRVILEDAVAEARSEALFAVDDQVDKLYESVYAAIPVYTDFHYSLRGEYMELTAVLLGDMSEELETRLFRDFSTNLEITGDNLDAVFLDKYKEVVDSKTREEVGEDLDNLGPITSAILSDSVDRAKVTAPMAAAAATFAGSGAVRALTTTMVKTLAKKMAAKAGMKLTIILGGAGGGFTVCAWTGPVAFLCALAGGVIAWFATDLAIINLDEIMNRDEFEADLRAMIDDDKEDKKRRFRNALRTKAIKVNDFTLAALNGASPDNSAN